MRPFDYSRADGAPDAAAKAAQGATILAGGTNLLDLMKLEVMAPEAVVDISRLDLTGITPTEDGGLRIGALVTNTDLANDRTAHAVSGSQPRLAVRCHRAAAQQGDDRRQPSATHPLPVFL